MEARIVKNSNQEYHAGEGVSSSGLKLVNELPLKYWDAYLNPNAAPEKRTKALEVGTLIHTLVLEPETFRRRYQVIPEGVTRQTKIGKELHQDIEDAGLTPIAEEMYATAIGVANAIKFHPVGRHLFGMEGEIETSIYWTDAETGVLCKIRPDYFIKPCKALPNGLILDVKSTTDASAIEFSKQSFDLRYHLSAAFYSDGFQLAFDTRLPPPFLWVAGEKSAPFAVQYFSASEHQIKLGRYEYRRALNTYAECKRTGVWPGYPAKITPLDLPAWGLKELDLNEPKE